MTRHVCYSLARVTLALAPCLAGGCATFQFVGGDRGRNVPTYDAKTFYETTSVFGGSFSHDESRILITTDATGVFNVYSQPAVGGAPTMLTNSTTDSIFGVSFFPHDNRILYSSDQGGNERNHLRRLDRRQEGLLGGNKRAGSEVLRPL